MNRPLSISLYLVTLLAVLLNSACVRKIHSGLLLPNDVSFAAQTNVLRATYQVPNWKDVLSEELNINFEHLGDPKSFLGHPKAFVFGKVLQGNQNYLALSASVRSEKKLEEFIARAFPGKAIQTLRKFRYLIDGRTLIAWHQQVLLIINSREADTSEGLKEVLQELITLKKDEQLFTQNENFREAIKNDKDIALWANISSLSENELVGSFAQNLNLSDNYLHFEANFDEGIINAQSRYFTNPTLYADYKTVFSGSVKPAILSNLPIEKPALMLAVGVNPQGFAQLLDDVELTEKAKSIINAVTLSYEDFIEMISGDAIIALNDLGSPEDSLESALLETEAKRNTPTSDIVIGAGIRNQAIYDSLMHTLEKSGLMEKKEGYRLFFSELFLLQKDSILYLTKNPKVKDDFLAGKTLQNKSLLEQAPKNWLMIYADESVTNKTLDGNTLMASLTRELLQKEELRLESATINLNRSETSEDLGGNSLVLLQDKEVNALLAMLEVMKEIMYQTKIRLDPNYWHPSLENKEEE